MIESVNIIVGGQLESTSAQYTANIWNESVLHSKLNDFAC